MANSPEFVAHALDLLSLLAPVRARAMFGGHGLYARGVMFGLLDDDELFLKTDDLSRARFEGAGCRCWTYPGGPARTRYFRPPDEAHEEPEAMLPWARLALDAALRLAAAKARPGRRRQGGGEPARRGGGKRITAAAGKPRTAAKPSRRRASRARPR